MKRGFFTWATRILTPREGEPIQPRKTKVIYLFTRKEAEVLSYDLWVDGKNQEQTLTLREVRKLLSQHQYIDLIKSNDTIFEVPIENLQKYMHQKPLVRRKVENGNFTSGTYN